MLHSDELVVDTHTTTFLTCLITPLLDEEPNLFIKRCLDFLKYYLCVFFLIVFICICFYCMIFAVVISTANVVAWAERSSKTREQFVPPQSVERYTRDIHSTERVDNNSSTGKSFELNSML